MSETRNQYFISFGLTREEMNEALEYCRRKKQWKRPSDLARQVFWQHIAKYPAYVKKGTPSGRPRKEETANKRPA